MKKLSLSLIVFAAFLVTACTTFTLVEPQRHQISEFYSVASPIQWNRHKTGTVEVWTSDGPMLQAVRFFDGIDDGAPMFRVYGQEKKQPLFRAGMSATEVQEFVADSIAADGAGNVTASNLRPFQFGGLPGFRFDLEFLSANGLELEGIAAGVTKDEKLYLILYTGARSHYFEKHKMHVEQILQSIQTQA